MIRPIFVTAIALTLSACAKAPPRADEAEAPPTVGITRVALRPVSMGIDLSGTIVAREEAAILPELSGYRVLRVLADEGDQVRRGQPVALLDGALLASEEARLRAQRTTAQVAAERAQSEHLRVADLTGRGVIADETIAQRSFEARAAHAQLQSARAALREIVVRRGRLTLRSPVSGIIVQRALRPGEVAGTGTEPPFRIARDGLFELDAEAPEPVLSKLAPGMAASVTLASGRRLTGTVRRLGERIDPATRLGRVRILLPFHPGLRLGGFATASIAGEARSVRSVPQRALSYEGGPSVMTVDKTGRVARVPVRTGARGAGMVELLDGPPPGTPVLLGGSALVIPGQIVKPVESRP
jgi:HlyD family secretion protein